MNEQYPDKIVDEIPPKLLQRLKPFQIKKILQGNLWVCKSCKAEVTTNKKEKCFYCRNSKSAK